jgi:homoserine O-acetyltransferase
MRKIVLAFALVLVLGSVVDCAAAPASAPADEASGAQKVADIGDLPLANGKVLRGCRVGYRTFGRLNAARSNAVLFATWFTGNTARLVDLIGPGKLVDSSRYYVIAVDALADGVSSSPSNSAAQPRMRFPEIGIRDMVESQRALLSRVLHIDKLRAVMGISMGGMQAFQWAASHPESMERAIAIVGSPRPAAYDLLLWQAETDAILADPEWKGGDYTRQPVLRAVQEIHDLALSTPDHYNHITTREAFLAGVAKRGASGFDAVDRLRQLQAMMGHDVSAPFGGSLARAGAAMKVPLLVVVNVHDHMVTPGPALELAAAAPGARVVKLDGECGHLGPGCEPDKVSAAVADFLK